MTLLTIDEAARFLRLTNGQERHITSKILVPPYSLLLLFSQLPMNRGSLTTPPSPRDAPACLPASDSDWAPSGCELARKSRGHAFRVPSRGAPPHSGLAPASGPSLLLLRRPTPWL